MTDVRSDSLYANVSAAVSSGDGIPYDYVGAQPPPALVPPVVLGNGTGSVSITQTTLLEFMRRSMTRIDSPSATLASGGSAGSVQVTFGTSPQGSGIIGRLQGWPFVLSAAGALSGSPTSLASTASNQIRKVLVTLTMSAMPVASSFGLGGGAIGFVYGSAMVTSAGAANSGSLKLSYFDYVPLPFPSANEIPLGWLNVPNSYTTSGGLDNTMMITDFRATQGLNFSAMMLGLPQP